jgi:hypothetical protein
MTKYVSAAIKFTLKNPPKNHRGLRGINVNIGGERPVDLRRLIFNFTAHAVEFYAETMPEVSNEDIACQVKDACREILESLEVPEEITSE